MFRELGDQAHEAASLHGMAQILADEKSYAEALGTELDALRVLKAAGSWPFQAVIENSVGYIYALQGEYNKAVSHCHRAVNLSRESGNHANAADALDSLGYIYFHLDDFSQAAFCYEQAVKAYREIGSPFGESYSLAGLGETMLATGNTQSAHDILQQALTILHRLLPDDPLKLKIRLAELETQLARSANCDSFIRSNEPS